MDFSNILGFLFNCTLHKHLNQYGKMILSKCLRNKAQYERLNDVSVLHEGTDSFNRRNSFHLFLSMKNHFKRLIVRSFFLQKSGN